jgi:hypothetical protein
MPTISIKNGQFIDDNGRILNLRGVNLSGSSKRPFNYTDLNQDPKSTTFVGRPFPIEDAPEHFVRLAACGLTFVRFIITWEAIEHAGPGIYDKEYLDYVRAVCSKANEYGILIYIDPHQDVWSRWTGGDGAPLWTLEVAGFDVDNLRTCEAAVCQETYGTGHGSKEKPGRKLPKMIWPTNYFKLAAASMFTLFWAGERFAPGFAVTDDDGHKVNIQKYLQTHYINAMTELLKRLKGLDNVVAIGTMNEPSAGYINVADLSIGHRQSGAISGAGATELKYELAPTPFQGMVLGEGIEQVVGEWSNGIMQHLLGMRDRDVLVDPKGKKVWKHDSGCIWKQEGVWRIHPETEEPELLKPNYFADVDFGKECYLPFANKFANAMHQVWGLEDRLLIIVELPPLEFSSTPFPEISSSPTDGIPNAVNGTHWYDGITLFSRTWRSYFSVDVRTHRPVFGYSNIMATHCSQLDDIKRLGLTKMCNAPTLIGEVGIPFDMQGTGWKSLSSQTSAMGHTISCLEKNLLSFTLWCYSPDNSNANGDNWNGEDLSIFSKDQMKSLDPSDPLHIYDGIRAANAVIRPYAKQMAGNPVENSFDSDKGVYVFRGVSNGVNHPTEIFVPKYCCSDVSQMQISVSAGNFEVDERDHCFVVKYLYNEPDAKQEVLIRFSKATKSTRRFSTHRLTSRMSSFNSLAAKRKSTQSADSD